MHTSAEWLPAEQYARWKHAVNGTSSWWNRMPSYRCDHARSFLQEYGFPQRWPQRWLEFDHLMYQSFLFSARDYQVRVVSSSIPTSTNRRHLQQYTAALLSDPPVAPVLSLSA